jgi:phospholipid transport system substrate-binding protein
VKLNRIKSIGVLLAMLCLPAIAVQAAVDANSDGSTDPGSVIASAARAMLVDLDANRAEYAKSPEKLEAVVTRTLLPHFDTDYAAQLVLGRYWGSATPAQRKRFVEGFYHSMLRTYSSALADFTGDRLKVLPFRGDANAATASVRTVVRKSDGGNVSVNYSMRKTADGWKAWDVVIEGISYVKSFREDYGAEVSRSGLDGLIARLEANTARQN